MSLDARQETRDSQPEALDDDYTQKDPNKCWLENAMSLLERGKGKKNQQVSK